MEQELHQLGTTTGACTIIRDPEESSLVEHGVSILSPSLEHEAIMHDLRGPVAMAGSLVRQAMDMPDHAAASRQEILALAARCLEQTSRLLADVRLLFRPHDPVDQQPLDLVQVIEDEADGISGLEVDCVDVPRSVVGCSTTLSRMVRNILENAQRYAVRPDGSTHVRVWASRTPSHWSLHFDDDGPGIPVADIDSMFQPYYRGGSPPCQDGTGLGLAIVRAGAVTHGGTAEAANRSEGGLRVTVRIIR